MLGDAYFPFGKRATPFLTVDAIINSQAFRHIGPNVVELQLLNQLKLGSGSEIKMIREFGFSIRVRVGLLFS